MTAKCDDDWPRDVMLDLIMYLSRAKFPKSAEHLADSLMVFETERAAQRIADGNSSAQPALKIVPSSH